jgi:hypothetical protein
VRVTVVVVSAEAWVYVPAPVRGFVIVQLHPFVVGKPPIVNTPLDAVPPVPTLTAKEEVPLPRTVGVVPKPLATVGAVERDKRAPVPAVLELVTYKVLDVNVVKVPVPGVVAPTLGVLIAAPVARREVSVGCT